MNSQSFSALLLALVPVAFGCGRDNTTRTADDETTTTLTPAAGVTPSESLPTQRAERLDDAQIVTAIRSANVAEVDLGRIAVGRAKDEDVKEFAEMMISDHGEAVKDIDELVTKLGLTARESELSSELGVKAQATETKLTQTSGAEFDRLYMAEMVEAHRKLLDTLDSRILPAAENEELREMLTSMRSRVEKHLEHAQKVFEELE
jgi:putative membrane protein